MVSIQLYIDYSWSYHRNHQTGFVSDPVGIQRVRRTCEISRIRIRDGSYGVHRQSGTQTKSRHTAATPAKDYFLVARLVVSCVNTVLLGKKAGHSSSCTTTCTNVPSGLRVTMSTGFTNRGTTCATNSRSQRRGNGPRSRSHESSSSFASTRHRSREADTRSLSISVPIRTSRVRRSSGFHSPSGPHRTDGPA